ncbi:hypothetical protein Ahy_B10g100294 [Arachis hypogaea]|uniref:t-SNARE coiled-coil homology domain-containing protein n=1 Tax=Arachis hypogaea TaxID=3818 RepID=A0A444WWA7_ARAHY|nr:hypothetical protein Ahy_B10g100294 [Arachis hypogaea]
MSFQDIESGRPFGGSRRGLINGKQYPTQAVAAGIFQINTAVSTFQRLVNTLGTPKDTPELREKLHKTRLHIGQLVKDTSVKLKQASDMDHQVEVNPSKKIADAKLAKDFQAVLKEFQKAQRLAAERETAYTPFVPQAVLPSSYTASEVDTSSDTTPEQRALLVESRRQEVLFLDNEIAFNEAIIEEREQGIQEIQQQIGEVNEIFKDLAVLVHEQGAMIDDIGSNIENSHAATAQAKSQLAKASKTQRSNSSLTSLRYDIELISRIGVDGYFTNDMFAFGDIWDCASHRHHSSGRLVKDCRYSIVYQMQHRNSSSLPSPLLMISLD